MNLNSPLVVLFAGLVLTISSCYPEGPFTNERFDITLTLFDEAADFGTYKTYALADSVVNLGGSSSSSETSAEILALVRQNMSDLGYVEEPNPQDNQADLVVLVSKTTDEVFGAYAVYPNWWDYWGWYPYWGSYPYLYGPGWNPFYSWGGGAVLYNYTTGTLFIEILDPDRTMEGTQQIPVIWAAGINGLLEGSDLATRIPNSINLAFDQSPYLRSN